MKSVNILTSADFEFFAHYIEQVCGIHLKADKAFLIQDRLAPVLERSGFSSFAELAVALQKQDNRDLRRDIVEAITTNETYFFRDPHVFDLLKSDLLLQVFEKFQGKNATPKNKIRVLSAACSTGQEIYSVGMLLHELFQGKCSRAPTCEDVQLVGIDISADALEKSKQALYNETEIKRGLSDELRDKYFRKEGELWHLQSRITSLVNFREYNLLDPMAVLGKFPLIFCRNVLIYFEKATKQKILTQLESVLEPEGILFIGATENVIGLETSLTLKRSKGISYYQK